MGKLTDAQLDQLTTAELDAYEDQQALENPGDYFTPEQVADIRNKNKNLANSQSTDISTTESINIENSEKVSKETKKELKETEETNSEEVQEAKPKLVIKIPKPFALGYWIIDLSKLLGKLLAGILAAVTALLLGLIAGLLANLLQKLLDRGQNISQSDIDSALNGMDMNALLNQAQSEYDKQQKLGTDTEIDINKGDGEVTDIYGKGNTNRKNISNKNKYSLNKRNRKDILDSDVVKERDSSNNRNVKHVNNPNYGVYID